jgi:hypothetical protein
MEDARTSEVGSLNADFTHYPLVRLKKSRFQGKSRREHFYFAKMKHNVVPLAGSREKSYMIALYYIEISTKIIAFTLKLP